MLCEVIYENKIYWRDGNGTARKKLGRGESQKGRQEMEKVRREKMQVRKKVA